MFSHIAPKIRLQKQNTTSVSKCHKLLDSLQFLEKWPWWMRTSINMLFNYLENANSPSQVESFISFGRESLKSSNLRLFASDSSEVTWLETRDSRLILPCFCSSSANMKKTKHYYSFKWLSLQCRPKKEGKQTENTAREWTIHDTWRRFKSRNDPETIRLHVLKQPSTRMTSFNTVPSTSVFTYISRISTSSLIPWQGFQPSRSSDGEEEGGRKYDTVLSQRFILPSAVISRWIGYFWRTGASFRCRTSRVQTVKPRSWAGETDWKTPALVQL